MNIWPAWGRFTGGTWGNKRRAQWGGTWLEFYDVKTEDFLKIYVGLVTGLFGGSIWDLVCGLKLAPMGFMT